MRRFSFNNTAVAARFIVGQQLFMYVEFGMLIEAGI